MKIIVFWVVVLCSLVEFYRRFRVLFSSTIMSIRASETSVMFYQATQRYNPEVSRLIILMSVVCVLF
jgi:hypothetical protein